MVCKNCGAMLPDDALFCGDCGRPVDSTEDNKSADVFNIDKRLRPFKIAIALLAIAVAILGAGLITALMGNTGSSSGGGSTTSTSNKHPGTELSGTYIVGEDKELPTGRYNIYPADGETYTNIVIYPTVDEYNKKDSDGYRNGKKEYLYEEEIRGYKLKAGNVVELGRQGAKFELVEEDVWADGYSD